MNRKIIENSTFNSKRHTMSILITLLVLILFGQVSSKSIDIQKESPNNMFGATVVTKTDLMVVVKKRSEASEKSVWKYMLINMSKIMKTFRKMDDENGFHTEMNGKNNFKKENMHRDFVYKQLYFPIGTIARRGLIMQLK